MPEHAQSLMSFMNTSESLLVHLRRAEHLKTSVLSCPFIDLSSRQLCDLELLLNRAFYPLEGYLCQEDYESVLANMRLADGMLWPMPVTLDVPRCLAERCEPGTVVGLRDQEGFLLAILHVESVWRPDKRQEALQVFGTDDPAKHPAVRYLYDRVDEWYLGGRVEGLHLPMHYDFPSLWMTPSMAHQQFAQRGWRRVVGFQADTCLHCAHKEMILRASREVGASIFLHPLVGGFQTGKLDPITQVRCYQAFAARFPDNMIALGILPLAARWAGPREALWRALIHKNYGCSHVMLSDCMADPGADGDQALYPRWAGYDLVARHHEEIGIQPVRLKPMVYVENRAQYIPADEVREDMDIREISSQELQRRLEWGLDVPEWFSFPEVVQELRYAFPPRHKQGFTIFLTGFSGAGKSTLAKVLRKKFLEMRDRPVTLLDGDIVRRNLSSELDFSREHREINVRRIGFVASEITKNGGIAICAPIAPFEDSRQYNRELISRYGGYIEVYLSTPLEVCESRDRKGLYAKARKGMITGVTGIDDPYQPPVDPELTVDTSAVSPAEGAQMVLLFLEEQGYIK
ncbi:adenylylsulfate kinase [Desulfoplanes formicivorans]|uniref:Adenylyl-sulfate kinase n=2 Tax=Desulfoplanes formicivorans TaxID=1592317 RepID=A0A194ALC1_9BACT|nr:adenylylsulfate kinase [Desulfoplanes formicivorans]